MKHQNSLMKLTRYFLAPAVLLQLICMNGLVCAKEGILPGSSDKDPVVIEAEHLDVSGRGEKLSYVGDVLVTNGPSTMKAGLLNIYMSPRTANDKAASTDERVKNIEAQNSVVIDTKKDIYSGDRLTYDKEQNKIYLNGNVTIKQKDSTIKSEALIYDKTTEKAVLTGKVFYTTKDTNVSGDKMDYDRKNNKAVIIGNVTYTKNDAVVRGNKMTYDFTTAEGFVENTDNSTRVKAIFTPGSMK
ncbi:MAG: LptA/OstA family protein [Methylocystis sp.]